jgi:hypothetical protein
MSPKQIMIPVQVPWMIDPATPFLRLTAAEDSSAVPTQVEFFANFPSYSSEPAPLSESIPEVVRPPRGPRTDADPAAGSWQLLCVTFVDGIWARISPAYSDTEIVDPSRFGHSTLYLREPLAFGMAEWLQEFRESWGRNGICPDPRMYEIQKSDWLHDVLGEQEKFKHFLLMGHDAYVEVIARGWDWAPTGRLP